jgi:putative transposase
LGRRVICKYGRLNEARIRKYIVEQEKHDLAMDKISVKEYADPFKG